MNRKTFALLAGGGCAILALLALVGVFLLFLLPFGVFRLAVPEVDLPFLNAGAAAAPGAVPTLTPQAPSAGVRPAMPPLSPQGQDSLTALYEQVNPGVVSIRVYMQRGGLIGEGAGSGFILDEEGHIVTNNHVVEGAQDVTVVFYNGLEAHAEVVGTDPDSDLAVVKVDSLPEGTHPLPLGDSDAVQVGEWVIAIGNPFGLSGSMTVGIVSAVGRTIPSGATPFTIPQAIQTDAAINPGNSGGPLLDLAGQVVGVNAQIASGSGRANAGVGFAIPSNIVRRVAPVLIENGSFQWPWLGIQGDSVNLLLMEANNLDVQQGAYIAEVVPDGPADQAGLHGATGVRPINGFQVPVGGDVIIEVDGNPVRDFSDLLVYVASQNPGDTIELTILRDGQRRQVSVRLAPRPTNFSVFSR